MPRLTHTQRLEIRRRYKSGGVSCRDLAKEYGCSFSAIASYLRRCKVGVPTRHCDSNFGSAVYHKDRKCRECKGKIEKSRWWTCHKCKPELESVQEDWIYESFNKFNYSELPTID